MINRFKSQVIQIFRTHSLPRWLVFLIDTSTVLITFLFAYLLRFNLVVKAFSFAQAFHQALFVLLVYAIIMIILKSYHFSLTTSNQADYNQLSGFLDTNPADGYRMLGRVWVDKKG